MKKSEFISSLRNALSGTLSNDEIEYHIRYYNEYINSEVRKGLKEEDVIDQIGDPRLIAKTIINTESNFSNQNYKNVYSEDSNTDEKNKGNYDAVKRTLYQILALVIVIFVIVLIIGFIGGIIMLLVKFAIPILIILIIIYLIRKLS